MRKLFAIALFAVALCGSAFCQEDGQKPSSQVEFQPLVVYKNSPSGLAYQNGGSLSGAEAQQLMGVDLYNSFRSGVRTAKVGRSLRFWGYVLTAGTVVCHSVALGVKPKKTPFPISQREKYEGWRLAGNIFAYPAIGLVIAGVVVGIVGNNKQGRVVEEYNLLGNGRRNQAVFLSPSNEGIGIALNF